MLKSEKKHSLATPAVFVVSFAAVMLIAMLAFLAPSFTAFAAELGKESPEIYCTYFKDNEEVDGNRLTAGTYDVRFNVKGVEQISTLQLTATYDSSVTIDSSSLSLMSDELADVTSMGSVINNVSGDLVLGFVSDNTDCSSINFDGQVIATMSVTFAENDYLDADGRFDAAKVIIPSANPHHTFIQVNYNDGYADEYSLTSNEDAADYNGVLHPMACDITPSKGHSVSGSLVIMTDIKGNDNGVAPYGEYTINIYNVSDFTEETEPIRTINTVYTEDSNSFVIDALPTGTYYASISSEYAKTRDDIVIAMGNEDITDVTIPIVACDYNKDTFITAADAGYIYSNMAQTAPAYDLNGDTYITAADAGYIYSLMSVEYNGFEIK